MVARFSESCDDPPCPQGPFTYEALPPEEIKFRPLKQAVEFKADDLMEVSFGEESFPF